MKQKYVINEKQLISLIKKTINETSLNKKLGSMVKSDSEMRRLKDMLNNGQTTMQKNGKTVDIENELKRKGRQKDTFAKGGAKDIALQYDADRETYKNRHDRYIRQRDSLMAKYKMARNDSERNYLKDEIDKINNALKQYHDDTHGYKIYGNGDNGYHIDTPKGKAYSTDSADRIVYSDPKQGNTDRLSKLNGITNAMMGYHDELDNVFDKKLMDTQRRQKNVQALRDYEQDHTQWEEDKRKQQDRMDDYQRQPFLKKMFSKKPKDTLRPEPKRPTWTPNDKGQFDGYFPHEDPKDYDKDMEDIRQRKQKYGQALNNMRKK